MIRGRVAQLLLVAIALAGCKQPTATYGATTARHPSIWFGDVSPTTVDATTMTTLVKRAWQQLHSAGHPPVPSPRAGPTPAPSPRASGGRVREGGPALLFLSISDGTAKAHVVLGAGKTLPAALAAAVALARKKPVAARWLTLDVVTMVQPLRAGDKLARGLDGVASKRGRAHAVLPAVLAMATKAERDATRKGSAYRFRTSGIFYDGTTALPLFRGHARRKPLTAARALAAARAGGAYLSRMRYAGGKLIYRYDPVHNTSDDTYNLVRHAGTVYALLQLYRASHSAELLAAAQRSADYMMKFIVPYRAGSLVLRSDDFIKLGGAALAAVALAEHVRATGSKRYLPTAQRLCKYIVWSQQKDGSVVHKRAFDSGRALDFRSQYYPGEAMLALMRTYALDHDKRWLNAAAKIARYLIDVRDAGKKTSDLIHDHWLLYALNELYRARKDPAYLAHAARIVESILAAQRSGGEPADYVGSYYDPPRSTPTATRSEGLLAAHALISEFGDKQLAERIRRAVKRGVGFQLQTQITRERAMYLRDPRRCLGGFTRGLSRFEVRIDYVQHNISALILLHQLLSP